MTDAEWGKAYKAVSSIQRHNFGRSKAGRPINIKKLKKALELLQSDGQLKDKASRLFQKSNAILSIPEQEKLIRLGPEKEGLLESGQVYLSRVRKRLK
jgi:hypothetical protein